ncbi:hypothetical protein N3K66_002463 [Trichothecium roseum]|uniref:Uncharacterized protein n=1 Tax=Trichothecium roseum TaxID=47278 RepID=A0ACC0VB36_9HYPO|nr:hypothetical protein N3K66_002463 [Trichothecium roseum]
MPSPPSSSRDGNKQPPSVHSLPKFDTKTPAAAASPSPRGSHHHQQQQRRRRQSRPSVPGIVTTPVVEPSHDPSTGLDIFPRLPEPPSPPHEPSSSTTTTAAADAVSTPSPSTLKARLANLFTSRSPSTTANTTAAGVGIIPSSPSSPLANTEHHPLGVSGEPASPAPERCGSHIYCRHTWDEDCKCVAVLELRDGAREYCPDCWDGKCRGAPAQPHLAAAASSYSSHSSPPAGPAETSPRESLDRDARGANKKGSWGIDLWGARPGSRPSTPKA